LAEVKGVNPWAENLYDKYDQESNSEPSEWKSSVIMLDYLVSK
jgi:hypothetical protein